MVAERDTIHEDYVREFIKLSLWYVHRTLRNGEADFEDLINVRVNIYRNTSLYTGGLYSQAGKRRHPAFQDVGPQWRAILEDLRAICDRHRDNPSSTPIEKVGLEMLWPYLEARLRQQGPDPMPDMKDRPYECWRLDPRNDRINLHIINMYRPKSPLSEMWIAFAAALIRLLRDARARHPEIQLARCNSWLNSAPRFQELFPESWVRSTQPSPSIRFSMGHWGQFTDRRGSFHAANGQRFRQTGSFPFPCVSCECPVEEIQTHLEASVPEAVDYNLALSA